MNFIRGELTEIILKVLNWNADLVEAQVSTPEHLDGFMSVIHNLILVTKDKETSEQKTINLMVKVMKGDVAFRESSLAKTQFTNEIYIYTNVIPAFTELLKSRECSIRGDTWCPRIFYGQAGKIPNFSNIYETVLVMENMTLDGFKAGPRNDLDEAHLTLMAKRIAQFHACTYAMKIENNDGLEKLVDGIIPMNFSKDGQIFNSYAVLFKLGLDRIFEYIDEHPAVLDSDQFKTDVAKLRSRHGNEPIHLMQKFLERNEFSVILHGDYNRNNVFFKYENDKPVDLRMFDFQENRYATPSIDLTFFMSMSMPTGFREKLWTPLLKSYHDSLMDTLIDILKCDPSDPRLEVYSYSNFMNHMKKFGLYGAIIAAHFLPWMLCSEEECAQLAHHFTKDINSADMKHWTRVSGGEAVDKRLIEIFRHMSQMGYFSIVDDD
ncbi:AAEL000505-PA [Aedes aegypti]|uniref:AAEL000505-PA n=1 Tax=Aedes aegypti TaxID=7159 RepID=Q17P56_AEDAE|nr:AAEL000505-PA [Aedes aegypti]